MLIKNILLLCLLLIAIVESTSVKKSEVSDKANPNYYPDSSSTCTITHLFSIESRYEITLCTLNVDNPSIPTSAYLNRFGSKKADGSCSITLKPPLNSFGTFNVSVVTIGDTAISQQYEFSCEPIPYPLQVEVLSPFKVSTLSNFKARPLLLAHIRINNLVRPIKAIAADPSIFENSLSFFRIGIDNHFMVLAVPTHNSSWSLDKPIDCSFVTVFGKTQLYIDFPSRDTINRYSYAFNTVVGQTSFNVSRPLYASATIKVETNGYMPYVNGIWDNTPENNDASVLVTRKGNLNTYLHIPYTPFVGSYFPSMQYYDDLTKKVVKYSSGLNYNITVPTNDLFSIMQVIGINSNFENSMAVVFFTCSKYDPTIRFWPPQTGEFFMPYPFGIESRASHSPYINIGVSFPFQYFPLVSGMSFKIDGYSFSSPLLSVQVADVLNVDKEYPIIQSMVFTHIGDSNVMLTIHITDNLSGFSRIESLQKDSSLFIDEQHLVQGHALDGIYQVLLDSPINYYQTFAIYDKASSFFTYNMMAMPESITNFKEFAFYQFSISNITFIDFEKNDVDLSNGPVENTLYLNVSNASPVFGLQFGILNQENSLFSQATLVQNLNILKWNPEKQLYQSNFTMKAGSIAKVVNYYIVAPKNVLITSDDISWIPGSQLRISSNDGDIMPPLVKQITLNPGKSFNYDPVASSTMSWTIELEPSVNAFKNGTVVFKSNVDLLGYKFTFSQTNDNVFTFPIKHSKCLIQEYYIAYLSLEDVNGNLSEFDYDDLQEIRKISPLLKFSNLEDFNIVVSCAASINLADIYPPELFSLQLNTTTIHTKTMDRSLQFSIALSDANNISLRHKPTVYFQRNGRNDVLLLELDFVEQTSADGLWRFTGSITFPYGYAFGETVFFSMYGLLDEALNQKGYSSKQLSHTHFTNSISIGTNVTPLAPQLKGNSFITYIKGGDMWIYGNHLGNQASDVKLQINYQDSFSQVDILERSNLYIKISVASYLKKAFLALVQVDGQQSNTLTITPSGQPFKEETIQCFGDCGGPNNGVCVDGKGCICIKPWTGRDCQSQVIVGTTPNINQTRPDVNIDTNINGTGVSFSSLISFVGIKELDLNGNQVEKYDFSSWYFTNKSIDSKTNYDGLMGLYQYNSSFGDGNITVTLEYYSQAKDIVFGNKLIHLLPYSLKYTISLGKYSFKLSTNTLQLIMSAQVSSNEIDSCTYKERYNSSDSQYIVIQVNKNTLRSRFIDIGKVDSRITSITNVILNDHNSSESNSNNKDTQTFVGINIPYYGKDVLLDPDFALLVDTRSASDKQGSICSAKSKSGLSKTQLIGIIIGSVCAGLILLFFLSYLIYKKKLRYAAPIIKMKEVLNK
ncbi:hypothetical protein CYY_001864 [Polysphondylium violaceum]|uniref:EGF-like domain-containing protein n=1 Tax=Polysphondylium violaceum TaxID=133409 RepID=A0A8J4PZE9_9MYCE|nr:hypothetical protein CYY_001864 [Polysphondylium violaceum]